MGNRDSISRTTSPFQKYIFHFLPGLPVLVAICMIFHKSFGLDLHEISKIIHELQLRSSQAFLQFAFFLVILIFALGFVFLFGLIVDSVRHMIEEMFLVPKWSEYKIPREFNSDSDKTTRDLGRKWDLYDKVHETEYYYIEFFGNVAISLAFLWGIISDYPHYRSYLRLFLFWMHIVFLVRPFFTPAFYKLHKIAIERWQTKSGSDQEAKTYSKAFIKGLSYAFRNVFCFRILDFSATFASILIILVLGISGKICTQAFHFYFIGIIMITTSFELYIVRFKRYQELLTGLFLNRKEKGNRRGEGKGQTAKNLGGQKKSGGVMSSFLRLLARITRR